MALLHRVGRTRQRWGHYFFLWLIGGLKMTDYYIIHKASRYVNTATFFQKVTQGLNESYKDLSDRAFDINEKAEKKLGGQFSLVDKTYLEVTNQTHLIEGV